MSVQENRTKWVAALRSGNYSQTSHVLCDGRGGYCCLGVLCDIYEEETGETLPKEESGRYKVSEETLLDFPQIQEWVGLKGTQGEFATRADINFRLLTTLNDEWDDWDFNKLADFIESEPEGLFNN